MKQPIGQPRGIKRQSEARLTQQETEHWLVKRGWYKDTKVKGPNWTNDYYQFLTVGEAVLAERKA